MIYKTLRFLLALGAGLGVVSPMQAQTFPSRPITMVVPYPAGGPSDAVGRVLADGMGAALHQTVVVENLGGASGSIGTGKVARAKPDGYTLILGNWSTHVVNPAVYALDYDVATDFSPVGLFTDQPLLIVGRKDLPPKDLKELVAWLKANPGKASAGGAGAGSANNIACVFFAKETATRIQFVPYRGGVQAMQDLLAGQIDLIFDLAASALPQVQAGTIKAYAVMAGKRLPAAPAVPTVDEAGLPGLHVSLWTALWAPRGTPDDVIATLNAAIRATLDDPGRTKRLSDLGQQIAPTDQRSPQALAAMQKAELAKWTPIIKAAGIKVE
jgi:tripartite-type tricarboxylate transporter receptor subunit TctC